MVENRPGDPRLHFGLAVELLNRGETREGAEALKAYLDLQKTRGTGGVVWGPLWPTSVK